MQNKDLSRFLKEIGLDGDYNVEEDLGEGFVKLKISEAERRQALQDISCVEDIIVELLRNSRDAGSTKIFISTKKISNRYRIINCIDDGIGIPPRFHKLIFASRVTSKLEDGKKDPFGFHGRGMALFSIKLNVDEIKIIFSDHNIGSSFYVKLDLENIPEKKDQSSYPEIVKEGENFKITGGVNNIIKTILQFQILNPEIDFYFGNQTQILATMRDNAEIIEKIPKKTLEKSKDLHDYLIDDNKSIIDIAGVTSDYNELSYIARDIFGMDISERNIQRVIYNNVEPLRSLRQQINTLSKNIRLEDEKDLSTEKKQPKKKQVSIPLKDENDISKVFKKEEIEKIKENIENVINKIGKKYFIKTNNDIECYKKDNTLRFIVELKQED